MANTKISALTTLNGGDVAADDQIPIVDTSAVTTKKIAVSALPSVSALAASDSAAGFVELATTAETNTGTDATRAVSPDALAGSIHGEQPCAITAVEAGTALTTGDGKAYFRIPATLNGMNLVDVAAAVTTTSSSGAPTFQIARGRQASATSAHSYVDMLSTAITIDATEYDSRNASTPPAINGSNDDVATGDLIRIDVDVAGTGTAGLYVTLTFRLP